MVTLHALGAMGLAMCLINSPSSISTVLITSKPKGKSTAKGTAMDRDGKSAKGTLVGKVAKVPTVKGTLAKEATPAMEVRPAKLPMGVKRAGPGKAVKRTPASVTSSPDKSVKRPKAPNAAKIKADAKVSKCGPATKGIPIAHMHKGKPATKPAMAARSILATKSELGT